ncbi:MAG: XRE family transcriptional regulator [Bacteroidota bacterium]|nr:XRE family transcriptional regulator [Bacteroidota bacterium]MDE2956928.1 XRE family transcriptional regulator [Bacteroidota bacterium]
MTGINPEILVWARREAGLELHEAAAKIRIDQDRLAQMERGNAHPSHSDLHNFAKAYRRPVLTFYLADIPRKSDYGADFRGRTTEFDPEQRVLLEALLRNAKASQELIRATMELEEEYNPIEFVGSLRRSWDLPNESGRMGRAIKTLSSQERHRLLRDALMGLDSVLGAGCTREQFREQPGPKSAFKLLRSACERAGVFVTLKGDLGSHHSALSTDLFRAFVIADTIAPYMVINSHDSAPARSFSILHEVVHLHLDQSGVSDSEPSSPVESFCNRVAGEWLLPSDSLRELWNSPDRSMAELQEFVSSIARRRNLSHAMVAVRLHQEGLIEEGVHAQLMAHFRRMWEESRQRERDQRRARKGGPSFYQVRRSHLGEGTLQFARRMMQSHHLAVTKAAVILSVKPGQVAELLKRSDTVR